MVLWFEMTLKSPPSSRIAGTLILVVILFSPITPNKRSRSSTFSATSGRNTVYDPPWSLLGQHRFVSHLSSNNSTMSTVNKVVANSAWLFWREFRYEAWVTSSCVIFILLSFHWVMIYLIPTLFYHNLAQFACLKCRTFMINYRFFFYISFPPGTYPH